MRLHPAEQRCGCVAGPVRVPVHAAHLQPGLLPRGDRGLLRLPRPRHQPRLHRHPHLVLRPASQGLMPYSAANYSRYIVRYGYSTLHDCQKISLNECDPETIVDMTFL